MFKDRFDAGRQLAKALQHYKHREGVVLAVPRGGVEIGYVVAKELDLPLDVVLTKKIGHPNYPEVAIGAVSMEGLVVTQSDDVSNDYIRSETARLQQMLRERHNRYYGNREPINLEGKIVIVVDDGIATGNTLRSTVELIRHHNPSWVVVAVPVAPPGALRYIQSFKGIDEIVCLLTPEDFYAVSQFYDNFEQVEDEEVVRLLHEIWDAKRHSEEPLIM